MLGIGPRTLGEIEDDEKREELGGRKSQALQDPVDLAEEGCAYFTKVTLSFSTGILSHHICGISLFLI